MGLFEELKELGVNVEEGLERVMGDASLYETMLGMFTGRMEQSVIAAADFDAEDTGELMERVHMRKGLTGNLSMTPLFEGYKRMLELLRAGDAAGAKAEYERVLPAETQITACIMRHTGS